MEGSAPASYGWGASQHVLEQLEPQGRVQGERKPKPPPQEAWQTERREAVKREIRTFLRAEDRRQAGIKKLLETIRIIESLDTDFGSFEQFGRKLSHELDQLKHKLRLTQKTFKAADGGFLETYALARERRIKGAERIEGRGGEVDYDEHVRGRSDNFVAGELDLGNDAVAERLRLEEEAKLFDLKMDKIWDNDVMLRTDVDALKKEAQDIRNAYTNTFLNLNINHNDLHARLDSWQTHIANVVSQITDDRETTFDLKRIPFGQIEPIKSTDSLPQGSLEQYLEESKSSVDEIFSSMQLRRQKVLHFTEQFSEKSAQLKADVEAENARLHSELLSKEEQHLKELQAKQLEMKKAEEEAARQRRLLMDDHKRLMTENDKEIERFRVQLQDAQREIDAERKKREQEEIRAQELAAKAAAEAESNRKAHQTLDEMLKERDKLMDQVDSEKCRISLLQSLMTDLQQQLDASNEGGDARVKVLEQQLQTAREKAASAEDKVTRLEQEIGTLNMDKEFFKNRASQMQEQVSTVDSQLHDTISMAKSKFAEITSRNGPVAEKDKMSADAQIRAANHSSEVEMLKKKQEQELRRAELEAQEAMAEKARIFEQQKQEMLEKMRQMQAEKAKAQSGDHPPRGRKAKRNKQPKSALEPGPSQSSSDVTSQPKQASIVPTQEQAHMSKSSSDAASHRQDTFITDLRGVETSSKTRPGDDTLEEDEEGASESEDENDMPIGQEEVERQQRELEEKIRLIEEKHKIDLQNARNVEEERLHQMRLKATEELQRVISTHAPAVSDEDRSPRADGQGETAHHPSELPIHKSVSGIQQVIKQQHEEMARIIDEKHQEQKKTKANYQMKLAVGLLKNLKPAAPPPAAEPPPPPIKPLGRATMLPGGNAPKSGWVPVKNKSTSNRVRVLEGPAVLQEEYAAQFGGQHRIKTPALSKYPDFSPRQEPPSVSFQPRHFFYGQNESRHNTQRPKTARARLQRGNNASSPLRSMEENDTNERVSIDSTLHHAQGTSEISRRPMSARIGWKTFNSDYHDALMRIHQGNAAGETALGPGNSTPLLHISQCKPEAVGGRFKGMFGSRKKASNSYLVRPRPNESPRLKGREIGGVLASSPKPGVLGGWKTKRESKDMDILHPFTSRLHINPRPESAKGRKDQL